MPIGLRKEEDNIVNIEEECKPVRGEKAVNARDLSKAQFNEYGDEVVVPQ